MGGSDNSARSDKHEQSNASSTIANAVESAQFVADRINDGLKVDQQPSVSDQGTKRSSDTVVEDSNASKRQHIEAEEAEELDLEAILAQLQKHTEQAAITSTSETAKTEKSPMIDGSDSKSGNEKDKKENEISESDYSARNDQEDADSEFSIEQQLKGALSSFQNLETESDAANHTSQFPKKQPTLELTDQSSGKCDEAVKVGESSSSGISKIEDHTIKSIGSSTDKQKTLISQMPLPPARLHGKLPPMPPPPPAFTSPKVPISTDLQHNLTHPASVTEITSLTSQSLPSSASVVESKLQNNDSKPMNVSTSPPKFSEVQPMSETYKKRLAEEIDDTYNESFSTTESGLDKHHYPLRLDVNKAVLQARKRSILLLDSLACQVLDTLSSNHYQDTLSTVMQPGSDRGMAYRILLDAFEDIKRIFMQWETPSSRLRAEPKHEEVQPFLQTPIPGVESTRENLVTVQRANLATFVAAIFGSIEIGFWELNDSFLRVFVPENGRLLKQQANIYLELKTQAYISALESSDDEKTRADALDHLFPADLETQMQDMFGERVSLAPTEKDFVAKCQRRKENIKSGDIKTLSSKYHWVPFLRDLSEYISRNHYTLLPQRKYSIISPEAQISSTSVTASPSIRSYSGARKQPPAPSARASSVTISEASRMSPKPLTASSDEPAKRASINTPSEITDSIHPKVEVNDSYDDDSVEKSKVPGPGQRNNIVQSEAKTKSNSDGTDSVSKSSDRKVPEHDRDTSISKPQIEQKHPDIPVEGHPLFPPLPKQVLPRPPAGAASSQEDRSGRYHRFGSNPASENVSSNNAPTDTLAVYEAARASAEGTDLIRPKASLYTVRRTWTKEEEEALLKGMDRVQGPYWAQILELYGPGGKINEVLKDRSQVQLKDKARNLKMFFVRLGLPIPAVFQYVTGDYETRKSSSKRVREKKQSKPPAQQSHFPQQQALQGLKSVGQNSVTQLQNVPSQQTFPEHSVENAVNSSTNHGSQNDQSQAGSEGISQATSTSVTETLTNSLEASSEQSEQNSKTVTDGVSEEKVRSKESENHQEINVSNKGKALEEQELSGKSELPGSMNEPNKAEELPGADEDLSSLLDKVGEYVENH